MTWWYAKLNSNSPQNVKKNRFFLSPHCAFKSFIIRSLVPTHTHKHTQLKSYLHKAVAQFSVIHEGISDVDSRLSHRDLSFLLSCHVSNPKLVSKFEADQRRWSCHVEIIPPPSERKLVISQWLLGGWVGGGTPEMWPGNNNLPILRKFCDYLLVKTFSWERGRVTAMAQMERWGKVRVMPLYWIQYMSCGPCSILLFICCKCRNSDSITASVLQLISHWNCDFFQIW